jgi:hypothetical protein
MEKLKYNLYSIHVSVIRDALETQIGHLQDRLRFEGHIVGEKEKDRLKECLNLKHEALEAILKIWNSDNGIIYIEKTPDNYSPSELAKYINQSGIIKNMENKELDKKFFISLIELLKEYIEPKSIKMHQEILRTVKNICYSSGYYRTWDLK